MSSEIHEKMENPMNVKMFEYRAKNVGARRAKGKWLVIVNQDDMFPPSTHNFIKKSLLHNHYYGSDRRETSNGKIPQENEVECNAQLLKDFHGENAKKSGFVPDWPNLGDLLIQECDNFYFTKGFLETNYNFALDSEYYSRMWFIHKSWEGHRFRDSCSIYHQNHAGMGHHPDGKLTKHYNYRENPHVDEESNPAHWGLLNQKLNID